MQQNHRERFGSILQSVSGSDGQMVGRRLSDRIAHKESERRDVSKDQSAQGVKAIAEALRKNVSIKLRASPLKKKAG